MNPGDRVRLRSIRPQYLVGVGATIVRKQPGEPRHLVRIDNDPQARRYAGGEWCVQSFTLEPDDSQSELDKLIREKIDPAGKKAAENWMRDIAPLVDQACGEFGFNIAATVDSADWNERWEDVYKPALLWRFYFHLSNELRQIAEGHEKVLFDSLKEER